MARRSSWDVQYPNAPLAEVACEVRFPGEVAVESSRERFWDKVRGDYPAVLVPNAQSGQPPALQHYRYQNPDKRWTVAVALNSFVLSDAKYTTHKPFLKEFERLHSLFSAAYPKLRTANRVGWRYVNAIPYVRESSTGLLPLRQYFKADFCMPASLPKTLRNVQSTVEVVTPDGISTIRILCAQDARDTSKEAFLLDLDFVVEDSTIKFKDVPRIMADMHRHNRKVFEDLITDEYRKYLRGESL